MTPDRKAMHPSHHWGPFADDPFAPELDLVSGPVWESVVNPQPSKSQATDRNLKEPSAPEKANDAGSP